MDKNDVLSVALDLAKGKVAGNYSKGDAAEALRQAMVDMNGGSTKINIKTFHRGNELFNLVEELIPALIEEGLKEDNPIFELVEYKNIADGDENAFVTEGNSLFVVGDAAAGIQGVRRQRIAGGDTVSVKTTTKIVRVYENLGRLLAGKISFDKFVEGVTKSFNKQILADAYAALSGITTSTTGLDSTYVKSGSYSEESLIELIDHVEASTGKKAKIYGTRSALRKVTTASVSNEAKADMYNLGYYGRFNGTEMICLAQAHKQDGKTFILDNNKLYIVASEDKPVKMVNEGEGVLIEKEASINNDLTQEYIYAQPYGTGVICADKLGVYTIS
mgnify:CR=1 FL=1